MQLYSCLRSLINNVSYYLKKILCKVLKYKISFHISVGENAII